MGLGQYWTPPPPKSHVIEGLGSLPFNGGTWFPIKKQPFIIPSYARIDAAETGIFASKNAYIMLPNGDTNLTSTAGRET